METRKNLLQVLGDWWATRRISAVDEAVPSYRALNWLGRQLVSSLIPVALVLILLTTFPGLAAQSSAPMGTSLSTIPYQGRLADASGNPITDRQNMEFRLYDTPVGGTPLWEEFWTGGNSVNVSDGLFSVMLGSINTGLVSVVQGNDQLYLGITVGTDTEMAPRVQLGSAPISMIALTVPDGSVTGEKIADGVVTSAHLNIDDGLVVNGDVNLLSGGIVITNTVDRTSLSATGLRLSRPRDQWGQAAQTWFTDQDTGNVWGLLMQGGSFVFKHHVPGGQWPNLMRLSNTGDLSVVGSISHGALIENNLQSLEELASEQIARFTEGDVLCWDITTEQLERCAEAATFLVQAVADPNGKPIIIGAELIKVLGPVQAGELLVASDMPGYAVAWRGAERPPAGAVIAQALTAFEGERGLIKAMIRKF